MKVLNDYFLATQTLNSTRDSVYVSSQVSCFKDEHVENTGIVAFRGKAVSLWLQFRYSFFLTTIKHLNFFQAVFDDVRRPQLAVALFYTQLFCP